MNNSSEAKQPLNPEHLLGSSIYGERNEWQGWRQPHQPTSAGIATWAHGYDNGELNEQNDEYPFRGDLRMQKNHPHTAARKERHTAHRRPDITLYEDICHCLAEHTAIDPTQIEIKVQDGEVTLVGVVKDRRTKQMVVQAVDHIVGIVLLHDNLRTALPGVNEDSGRFEQQSDARFIPYNAEPPTPAV